MTSITLKYHFPSFHILRICFHSKSAIVCDCFWFIHKVLESMRTLYKYIQFIYFYKFFIKKSHLGWEGGWAWAKTGRAHTEQTPIQGRFPPSREWQLNVLSSLQEGRLRGEQYLPIYLIFPKLDKFLAFMLRWFEHIGKSQHRKSYKHEKSSDKIGDNIGIENHDKTKDDQGKGKEFHSRTVKKINLRYSHTWDMWKV